MSLVTAAPSLPSIERLTRRDVLTRFLRETSLGITGTVLSGATSTFTDTTRLQSSQFSDDEWAGTFARISYTAGGTGAAPEGQIRPVRGTGYSPGNGTIEVAPVFSAAPGNGDIYQLWRGYHPQDALDHLDDLLVNECWLPCWTILTEVPDGDMEQSDTTDWTASNATITKISTEPAMAGKRWLSVVNTSSGGYAESATLSVVPGYSYHVSSLVQCGASTTAQLVAYDKSNSAAITTITTSSRNVVRLWTQFTAPSGCYQVSLRLGASENSVTTKWDEVCFYGLQDYSVALPWWVRNPAQVKGVFRMRMEVIGTNLLNATMRGEEDQNYDIQPDTAFGRNQLRITARRAYLTDPLFILGTRNETAYSDENTDLKHVDANWVQAGLAYKVFNQIASRPGTSSYDMKWATDQLGRWTVEWERRKRQQETRLTLVRRSTPPDGYFYRQPAAGQQDTYWVVP